MSVADKQMAMRIRREVVRRSLDASQLTVFVTNGMVELGGRITPLERRADVDIAAQLEIVKERAMRIPGVRDVRWTYLMYRKTDA